MDVNVINKIPKGMDLVYWDYYSEDEVTYQKMMERHMEMGGTNIIFAGGAWRWSGLVPHNRQSIELGKMAYKSMKDNSIKELLLTSWGGDNGGETDFITVMPVYQYWAEMSWREDDMDEKTMSIRFETCVGGDYESFLALDCLNDLSEKSIAKLGENPSKYLLYEDPMIGLIRSREIGQGIARHSAQLIKVYTDRALKSPIYKELFNMMSSLSKVLSLKADLSYRIYKAYQENDNNDLMVICDELIPCIIDDLSGYQNDYRKYWHSIHKPFGIESFDLRTGGLKERLQSSSQRIKSYVNGGDITVIEELEIASLPFIKKKVNGIEKTCVFWEEVSHIGTVYGV